MGLAAADVILIITAVLAFLLMVAGAIYFIVYFQHPDDKNVAWFPKIIVTLGVVVACTNVLLMPLDVATQNGSYIPTGVFPMLTIELVFFLATIILFFAVIPFAYFYYEGWSEDDKKQSVGHQLAYATKWTVPLVLFWGGLTVGIYWYFGYAVVDLTVLAAPLRAANNVTDTGLCAFYNTTVQACTSFSGPINLRVPFTSYIIAMVNLVGWLALVFFGGVGLIATPVDFIQGFIHRPRPMKLAAYTKYKTKLGEYAQKLLERGRALEKETEEVRTKSGRAKRKVERKTREYQGRVMLLESRYKSMEVSYKSKGGNIIWEWTKLFFGICSIILTAFWLLQFFLYTLPVAVGKPPVIPLINTFLILVAPIPFLGPVFYGLFAFYLLLCILKGCIMLGLNFGVVKLYPMALHDTLMNALLFNICLFLAGSLAVVHLCSVSFADYARFTSVISIFGVQISQLKGISVIFSIYVYVLLAMVVLTAIYLAFRKYRRAKDPSKNIEMVTFDD